MKVRSTRAYFVAGICGIILLYFNNCQTYSENNLFDYQPECLAACGGALKQNLSISADQPIYVDASAATFVISGICNDGGFPANYIRVRTADYLQQPIGTVAIHQGACPSDRSLRYSVQVSLPNGTTFGTYGNLIYVTLDIIGQDNGVDANSPGDPATATVTVSALLKPN